MESNPEAFFLTDHYVNYPAVVVRLSEVVRDVMKQLLTETWRELAPKKVVAEYDERRGAARRR